MNLNKLLIIHAVITFAAGVVLIIAPDLFPGTVGIHIDPHAYLICYFLGAAELGLAFLSYYSRALKDISAIRLVSLTFIVFHGSTALLEVYAFTQGLTSAIWGNVAIRILAVILFAYYGLHITSTKNTTV